MKRCAAMAALGSALVACSSQQLPEAPATACVQGQTAMCTCDGRNSGIATCRGDGLYGACMCATLEAGSGGTAGAGTAGAGGTAGSGTAGVGGTAGSGTAGVGGSGGAAGDGSGGGGGSAGVGGSGGDAGAAGSAGASGQGGAGGTDAAPEPAAPGELYGPCANGGCNAGLFCATVGAATYCTHGCGPGAGGACSRPATGTVNAQCAFGFCVLGTCANAECPAGMQCVPPSDEGGLRVDQCVFP